MGRIHTYQIVAHVASHLLVPRVISRPSVVMQQQFNHVYAHIATIDKLSTVYQPEYKRVLALLSRRQFNQLNQFDSIQETMGETDNVIHATERFAQRAIVAEQARIDCHKRKKSSCCVAPKTFRADSRTRSARAGHHRQPAR